MAARRTDSQQGSAGAGAPTVRSGGKGSRRRPRRGLHEADIEEHDGDPQSPLGARNGDSRFMLMRPPMGTPPRSRPYGFDDGSSKASIGRLLAMRFRDKDVTRTHGFP